MRTLIVGDIHGQLRSLLAALGAAERQSGDRLIFLGDYVNGGMDSASVLDLLIELRDSTGAICLRGNHDDLFESSLRSLRTIETFLALGGTSTLQSYPTETLADVPDTHRAFLRTLPLAWHDDHLICIHGRIAPNDSPEAPDRTNALWGRVYDAKPHASGRTVICGHSAQRAGVPLDLGHTVCIDTDAKHGGWLTLLELPGWTLIQANERGEVRRGRLR